MSGYIRQIQVSEGEPITAPTPIAFSASQLYSFVDDAAYEAQFGAGAVGCVYFNTTAQQIRIYKNGGWEYTTADEIGYDHSGSFLLAENAQAAIDELDGITDSLVTDLGTLEVQVDNHEAATTAHGVSGVVAGTQGSTFDTMGIAFEDIATDLANISILPAKIGVRMTGLTAIRNLVGINPLNTGEIVLVNDSGFSLMIVNEHVGTTDANKIITGTGASISLAPGASLKLTYDPTETRWRVIGGTGSGSGGGGGMEVVSISAAQTLSVNRHYLVDSSGGGFSLTLPDPAGFTAEDLLAARFIVEDSALAAATPANEFSVYPHSGGKIATNSSVLAVDEPLVHDRRGWAVEYSWDGTLGHYKAQDYLGASGGQYTRTRIPLADNATTSVQNFAAFDAAELFGWVYINATTSYRFYVSCQVSKNGAGSDYNVSYQTSGDTPPVGFDVSISAAGLLSVILPAEAGFVEADINYSLNVATETAALPLSIDASVIQTGTIDSARLPLATSTVPGAVAAIKQYVAGSDFTISSDANATVSFNRSVIVLYQTYDGAWRAIININLTHGADVAHSITITGLTFKNSSGFFQSMSCSGTDLTEPSTAYARPNESVITVSHTVGAVTTRVSGDVELDSKPSWAD